MKDLIGLIQRHRAHGIIVDTNILLLYFLGRFDPEEIPRFKRTQQFTPEDYETLVLLLRQFDKLLTTPNILTEVNSLSGQMGEPRRTLFFRKLASEMALVDELYLESRQMANLAQFVKLGLTDAGILSLAQGSRLVLTEDSTLTQHLQHMGIDVINFNHVRVWGW
jgi:rRNA-processing protein FCF1